MNIWRMRIAYWIPQVYNHTLINYVTIIDFALQQRLYERASMLRFTYIALQDALYLHIPHRAVNTLRLCYKNQSVNVV
jgi:hypothetical protein